MKAQFKNIISIITIIFLFLVLFSNGYFQKEFFTDKWSLPEYMANILLIVENGAKVLLELAVSVLPINGLTKKKYLASLPFMLLVVFLVSFGIFQSFATRTFYTQKEINASKIAELKSKAKRLRDLKKRFEKKLAEVTNDKNEQRQLEASIKKQTLQFINKLDADGDKWLINKRLDKLGSHTRKEIKKEDQTAGLLKKIEELDFKLVPLSRIKFTYTEAMTNVFVGQVSSWDIVSDVAPALTMEALIVLLTAFLGFFWKPEIAELLVYQEEEQEEKVEPEQKAAKKTADVRENPYTKEGITEYVEKENPILDYEKVKPMNGSFKKPIVKLQDEIVERLKEKIYESQLSQEEFANDKLGISKVGLWKILSGNVKTINPEIFEKIMKTVA